MQKARQSLPHSHGQGGVRRVQLFFYSYFSIGLKIFQNKDFFILFFAFKEGNIEAKGSGQD